MWAKSSNLAIARILVISADVDVRLWLDADSTRAAPHVRFPLQRGRNLPLVVIVEAPDETLLTRSFAFPDPALHDATPRHPAPG